MTKQEFFELFDSVIEGRSGYSVVAKVGQYIHVYSVDNTFSANFITRVVEMTGDYFIGITVDADNKPYLLFCI